MSCSRNVIQSPLVKWLLTASIVHAYHKSFVAESPDPSDSLAVVANFTFVARDSETGKSALVNQISSETEKEKLLWKEADEINKIRKKKKEKNREIEDRLNALLAEGRIFSDMPALADRDSILTRDTCLENSFICQQHPGSDFWSEGHLN